jgi:hypothetical protein
MCFFFVVVSVVFAAKTSWFYGFLASTAGNMKANCFNVVHDTKV